MVPWEADRTRGRFTYVGPQVVKMLGYPQEAWLAEGFLHAHVHADDRESTRMHLLVESGVDDFDFRMTAADGRTLWLHNVVSTRGQRGSDVIGGFLFDVTERKEASEKLRESEERFRSTFELGLIGMVITSPTKASLRATTSFVKS